MAGLFPAGFFVVFSLKIDFIFRNAFAVYLALLVILALQIVVGGTVAGTKSWFRLWGIGFQFSEFVKVPLALFLAKILTQFEVIDGKVFIKVMAVIAVPVRFDHPPARHGRFLHSLRVHPDGHPVEKDQAGGADGVLSCSCCAAASSAGIPF